MFSLMLSSEDFPIPMETSDPQAAGSSHLPTIGAPPISRALFPPSQASHTLLPPPLPPPPPPPSTAAVPPVPLEPGHNGAFAMGPGLPPATTFAAPTPANPLKRCDDDVQFVSEKPVKRQRLESPAAPEPVGMPPQRMLPPQAVPPLFRGATAPVQGQSEGPAPPVYDPIHTVNVVSEHTPKAGGTETERRTSLPSMAKYRFPPSVSSDPAACRRDSPQLSPKQTHGTGTPSLLQRPHPPLVISSPERKSQEPPGEMTGPGGPGVDTGSRSREKEAVPLAQSSQKGVPEGNAKPMDIGTNDSAAPPIPPIGNETNSQSTVSAVPTQSLRMPVSEVTHGNGPTDSDTPSRHQSTSQGLACQDHRGSTAASATVAPGCQQRSRPPSPTAVHLQRNPAAPSSPAPNASVHNADKPAASEPWRRSVHTLPANTGADIPNGEGHCPQPSAPKSTVLQGSGPGAPARPQMPGRSPSQFQAKPSNQPLTRPQPQVHSQGHSHGQIQHHVGHHPPGSGPPKAPCQICIARRQQAALERVAALGGGKAAFPHGTTQPPGTVSAPGHAQASAAGYNVVFVPTPVQGQNGLGAQFNPHPRQPSANPGVMGMPSHPYMLQNHQQGMMAPALSTQTSQPPPPIQNQGPQPRPSPRTSPQGPPPRRFAHQDPSPGKHIIIDIADTAMEVFPFAAVAARHNVPADKVRDIFEAVVGVPLLRVPADKRRAGRLGQERVKKYVVAKRGLERKGAAEGVEGRLSAREVAAAMGPEVPTEWAQGQGFRGPW